MQANWWLVLHKFERSFINCIYKYNEFYISIKMGGKGSTETKRAHTYDALILETEPMNVNNRKLKIGLSYIIN